MVVNSNNNGLIDNINEPELKLPLRKANFWFAIIWLMQLVDVMDRMAVNAVLPVIKTTFQLTDAQCGLVSSILGLSIALLAFPIAILADKWSRRKTVSLMVAVWSIMTFFTGRVHSYFVLLMARLGVGFGEAGYTPVSYSMISAWYPQRLRGTMIGFFYAATPVGNAVGILLASYIAYHFGWRAVFGVLAIPGLLLAVLAWFMPDFKTKKVEDTAAAATVTAAAASTDTGADDVVRPTVKGALAYIFKSPAIVAAFLIAGFTMMSTSTLGTWGPTFYGRAFSMNLKQAGQVIALISLITMFGAPIMGWLGDKLLAVSSRGRLIGAALSGILFLGFLTLALQVAGKGGSHIMVYVAWSLGAFFLLGVSTSVGALTQDLVPPHFRAMTAAFIPICNQLIGGVWGPVIAGKISDSYGLGSGLQLTFVFSIACALIAILVAAKFYDHDQKRMKAMGTFKLDLD